MREIGISPRFSRDKFVPLQTKQRYSTRDISGEVSLTLFFRGFVPFLSLADFVSRNKNLQVADLQRLKSCFGELVTATTSNLQNGFPERVSQREQRRETVLFYVIGTRADIRLFGKTACKNLPSVFGNTISVWWQLRRKLLLRLGTTARQRRYVVHHRWREGCAFVGFAWVSCNMFQQRNGGYSCFNHQKTITPFQTYCFVI